MDINKIQLQGTTYTLVDSTVPAWARAANKPTYTAAEVGAATAADIQSAISDLVNSAPTTLDTLNELATALGNDPNFATTIAGQIGAKYTKPGTGIPKTDLASDVQTSLGKADTAIQSADLATVATTGSYNDLLNTPTNLVHTTGNEKLFGNKTIGGAGKIILESSWDQIYNQDDDEYLGAILNSKVNSSSLATVATSGSYNDLLNTPTIPQVLNAPAGNETDAAPSVWWVAAALAEVDFVQHVDGSTIYINPDGDLAVKNNGITKTKLSSALQASIDKADGAIQSSTVTSTTLKSISVPNVTSVGTASTWSFTVGTGNDANTLIISGSNGTAPTLGPAISAAQSLLTNNSMEVLTPAIN